ALATSLYIPVACFSSDPPLACPYPLSLHDALPICQYRPFRVADHQGGIAGGDHAQFQRTRAQRGLAQARIAGQLGRARLAQVVRSEEHTSELQSRENLVCRLLLEKKKKYMNFHVTL